MYDCVIHLWNIPSVFGKKEERRRILNSIVIAMPLRFVNDGVSLFAVHNIEMTQPTNRTQVKVPRTLSLSLSLYLSISLFLDPCSLHRLMFCSSYHHRHHPVQRCHFYGPYFKFLLLLLHYTIECS